MEVEVTPPVHRRSFDALFGDALKRDAELRARLRSIGFDPEAPRADYPVSVFKDALELARVTFFSAEPVADGYRKVGIRWVDGFFRTTVGSVIGVAARLVGPGQILARFPAYTRAVRDDLRVETEALGLRSWKLSYEETGRPLPHFSCGIIERILTTVGAHGVEVRVVSEDGNRYELQASWR